MKYYIRTYGCQMNVRDSEAVSALLQQYGHTEVEDIAEADVLLMNTCSVRDSAERKVEGYLWKLREWKNEKGDRILALIGCMAQSRGEILLKKFPHLDIVLGTGAISRLPELLIEHQLGKGRFCDISSDSLPYDDVKTHLSSSKVSAYVPVMRGCGMNCSYCIVPQVRGREISRPEKGIIDEVKKLVDDGVKEIFLLGQNIAAYGLDGQKGRTINSPFAELLAKIANIDGVKRIRFTSPHPVNFNDALIKAVCEIRKICDCIHLPLQSGSDKILSAMGRGYTVGEYLQIIEKLKNGRNGICFSTDVIVGFPGETEEDFNNTRNVLNEVGFDQEFIFKYSKRKDTPASLMDGQLPEKIKEERNQILLEDLKKRVIVKNKGFLGKKLEVLFDGFSPRENVRLIGKTSANKTVVAAKKAGYEIGDFAEVLIEDYTLAALYGTIVK